MATAWTLAGQTAPEAPNKHTGPAQPLPTALNRPEQSGCRVLPGAGKVPREQHERLRDINSETCPGPRQSEAIPVPKGHTAQARVSVHWGLPSVPWGPHSLKGASHGPAAGTHRNRFSLIP